MMFMVGRVTLTKSVLQVFPTYVIQSTFLLSSLCDAIDKKCCSFV